MHKVLKLIGGCAVVFAIAMVPATVSAAKKGPRASLAAATVCAIDSADFNVTIRLTDKTSGSGFPVVTAWNVQGLAKTAGGNWNNQTMFDSASGGPEPDLADIEVTLDLCALSSDEKAVNADVSLTYEIDSGGDARTIENMCSDDPDTEFVVEPAGIKLTQAIKDAIAVACP